MINLEIDFPVLHICEKFLSIKRTSIFRCRVSVWMEAGKAVISEARSVWREAKRYRRLDRANNDSTIPNGVYISVFGGLRRSYQASVKRKGAGEGKKGEQGFVFIDIPERSSARFAKIYFRALIMYQHVTRLLFFCLSFSLSLSLHRVFCLLCIASWSATDDCLHCDEALEQTITIITFQVR